MLELGNSLDDVPVPPERQLPERLDMVANEGLAVEDDGEEMDGEPVVFGDGSSSIQGAGPRGNGVRAR